MQKLLIILCLLCCLGLKSQTIAPYPLLDSLGGSAKINLSAFKGQKLLLVNVDPSDSSFSQYTELISLSGRLSGCKVIIFPSPNSPSSTASQFAMFHNQVRSSNLILAAPQSVAGASANALYRWLQDQDANGQVSVHCTKPFYKILIGRDGNLEGVFGPKMKCSEQAIFLAINK